MSFKSLLVGVWQELSLLNSLGYSVIAFIYALFSLGMLMISVDTPFRLTAWLWGAITAGIVLLGMRTWWGHQSEGVDECLSSERMDRAREDLIERGWKKD